MGDSTTYERMGRNGGRSSVLGMAQKGDLIDLIRDMPCIWDSNSDGYKSSAIRQKAFSDISNKLSTENFQISRSQVQEEWGKLRYCFTRIVKKSLMNGNDSDAVSWPHWRKMRFMYELIKQRLFSHSISTALGYKAKNHFRRRPMKHPFQLNDSNFLDSSIESNIFIGKTNNNVNSEGNAVDKSIEHQIENEQQQQESMILDDEISTDSKYLLTNFLRSEFEPTSSLSTSMVVGATTTTTTTAQKSTTTAVAAAAASKNSNISAKIVENLITTKSPRKKLAQQQSLSSQLVMSQTDSNNHNNGEERRLLDGGDLNSLISQHFLNPTSTSSSTMLPISNSNVNNFASQSSSYTSAIASNLNNTNNNNCLLSSLKKSTNNNNSENLMEIRNNNTSNNNNSYNEMDSMNIKNDEASLFDKNDYFGKFIIQQIRTVSTQNPTLGVLLRKEIMEVCCKYEIQAFID